MYKNFKKSDMILQGIKDNLALRFQGSSTIDTIREERDADGWALIVCSDAGNEAAGQPVILVRIKAQDMVSKDILGGDIAAFAPHVAEIAFELDETNPEPSAADLLKVQVEIAKAGVKINLKQIADGTAVTAANTDAAAVVASVDDLYWPGKGV